MSPEVSAQSSTAEGKVVKDFALRITSLATGGFRKLVELPPLEVMQRTSPSSVASSEFEVRVRRQGFLFSHDTKWTKCHVFFTLKSQLILVYMTNERGFALRVPAAHRYSYTSEVVPALQHQHASVPRVINSLQYSFGELHLRTAGTDPKLAQWRLLFSQAHLGLVTENEEAKEVKKVSLKESVSATSCISTQTVNPPPIRAMNFKDFKKPLQTDTVAVRRYRPQKFVPLCSSPTPSVSSSINPSTYASTARKTPFSVASSVATMSTFTSAAVESYPSISTISSASSGDEVSIDDLEPFIARQFSMRALPAVPTAPVVDKSAPILEETKEKKAVPPPIPPRKRTHPQMIAGTAPLVNKSNVFEDAAKYWQFTKPIEQKFRVEPQAPAVVGQPRAEPQASAAPAVVSQPRVETQTPAAPVAMGRPRRVRVFGAGPTYQTNCW